MTDAERIAELEAEVEFWKDCTHQAVFTVKMLQGKDEDEACAIGNAWIEEQGEILEKSRAEQMRVYDKR